MYHGDRENNCNIMYIVFHKVEMAVKRSLICTVK